MTQRTTVRLPEELLARARKKAAAEGRTLTSLIEEGLHTVVDTTAKRAEAGTRTLPRCSTATGGLRPGIDPAKLSQSVQEMEDLEYIERLKNGFK